MGGCPQLADRADGLDLADLVAGVVAGREEDLRELYRRAAPEMMGKATRILGSREDAEELVQEVFLQIWGQASRYDPNRGSVGAWLAMITKTRAIDRLRSRQVRSLAVERMSRQGLIPAWEEADGVRCVMRRERLERLREALTALPREQEEILHFAYFGGWSQRQIAHQTGLPLGTVKTRTKSALRKLRAALGEEQGELL